MCEWVRGQVGWGQGCSMTTGLQARDGLRLRQGGRSAAEGRLRGQPLGLPPPLQPLLPSLRQELQLQGYLLLEPEL